MLIRECVIDYRIVKGIPIALAENSGLSAIKSLSEVPLTSVTALLDLLFMSKLLSFYYSLNSSAVR